LVFSVRCGSRALRWAQTFSYDAFGNINKTGNPGTTFAASYNTSHNQVNNLGFAYDANGNVQQNSVNMTFVWNAAGQPVTVNNGSAVVGATYDALGRLVETNNGGSYTRYIYRPSGDKLGAFRAGAIVSTTVPLPGGMGAVYNSGGLNYIRHMDYLGSSRLATTWAHSVYAKESYAPFGSPTTKPARRIASSPARPRARPAGSTIICSANTTPPQAAG
jgi:YD repeat-containing protein